MKKITCVGYHDTGSSVIDDLFREFEGFVQGGKNKECRLLQDPDGISDLEYNLIENPHRLNSGFALKRFRKMCEESHRTYENIFGKQWMVLVDSYIEGLISLQYKGYWHGDLWLMSDLEKLFYKIRRGINRLLPKKVEKPSWYNYYPSWITYHCHITEQEFLYQTQSFINQLCASLKSPSAEFIVLDQLVNPVNIPRYLRYIDELKVIVVDRDPRDVYIEQIRLKEHVLPKDPYLFSEVYRDSREEVQSNGDLTGVMKINFEDMIYEYESSVNKICEFVGVDLALHKDRMKHFNPAISIKNTKLWERYPEYIKEILLIEQELKDYLYTY